jgi:choline-sulfatase
MDLVSKSSLSRRAFVGAASALGALAMPAPQQTRPARSSGAPNILLVICDQMRGDAIGSLGNPNARTPNLNRMARQGVTFDNCFSNNPVCIPSRKSLFCGLYPHQHGTLTNQQNTFLKTPDSMIGHFKKQGYRIGYVGKNHTFTKDTLANIDKVSIRDREPFREYNSWSTPYWYSANFWPPEKCHPHLNTEDAIEFLHTQPKGERFFLTVSYFDPHPPYFAPAEHLLRRDPNTIRIPEYISPDALTPRLGEFSRALGLESLGEADMKQAIHHYHAAVEWGVDQQIGRLLDTLDRQGLTRDTVVLFVSDHGDFGGHYNLLGKAMFLHDSLLHVPMIWYAPGRIPQGVRRSAMTQLTDVYPTLLDLCGDPVPSNLSGRSLKACLKGEDENAPDRTIFTSAAYGRINFDKLPEGADETALHTRVLKFAMTPAHRTSMARTKEWKLVLNEEGPPELYKMNGGHVERANVAGRKEYAEVRRGMENSLTQWWKW